MILEQFYLGCLAHASYVVIDERTKTAAVIDPQRDVDGYIAFAERHGATIAHVLLTHFHADFVAGHLELRDRVGARIHLGARANAEYDFDALRDGDVLEFGDVRFSIRETPGHTPEGVSIVVFDLAVSDTRPHAVFTGDTLFVGDVGRPDLMASVGVTATELAGQLYDSLHDKLLQLPDDTLVYPAHGAGSMCGKNLSSETFSTIGQQRRQNYALQPMSRDEFVATVTADQPQAPAYFAYDAAMNQRERPTLDVRLADLRPLTLDAVLERQNAGAVVVDVRDADTFAHGHLRGAINVGLDGKFATWAGTLLHEVEELVIVADPGQEVEAATRLGRVGLDAVVGFLAGGPAAFAGRDELIATVERVPVRVLADGLAARPFVLDVRSPREWEGGHIDGAVNIPLADLERRAAEVPTGRPVAIVCRSGYRSSIAGSLLQRRGIREVVDVRGGMLAWQAAEYPTLT